MRTVARQLAKIRAAWVEDPIMRVALVAGLIGAIGLSTHYWCGTLALLALPSRRQLMDRIFGH